MASSLLLFQRSMD
uniref:Uncharacterized protein n=1 Tax=Arundo donax TaxID=35708 RepID=A0A0A9B2R1_ARUDO